MGIRTLQYAIAFFLLGFFLCSAGTILKGSEDGYRRKTSEDDLIPAQMTTQLDDVTPFNGVPIINPTTPATETPVINPISSTPFPPMTPVTNPNTNLPPMTPVTNPNTNLPPMTPVTNPNTNLPPMIGNGGTPTMSSGQSWCIASQSASETALQVALDYACGYGGADCSAIQQGGSCFNPDTARDHASYAFNSYYQKNPVPTSCDFGGTAMVTNTDPSTQNCQLPASSTSSTVPNVSNPYGSGSSPVNGQPVYGSVPNTLTPDSSFGAATSVDVTRSVLARLLLIVLIINHL